MALVIDRSVFLKASRCHKAAWLSMHSPGERNASPRTAYHFNQADLRNALVQVCGKGTHCFKEGEEIKQRIARTEAALGRGDTLLFDPMIEVEGMRISADVLVIENGCCKVMLVRAARGIKKRTRLAAAFMLETLNKRFPQVTIELAHVGNSIRISARQAHSEFIQFTDLTKHAEALRTEAQEILSRLKDLQQVADTPIVPIGPQCKNPYPCPFVQHCWGRLQNPRSVLHLTGNEGLEWELLKEGYEEMTEVPARRLQTPSQLKQVEAWRSQRAMIQLGELRNWYKKVQWPVAFLDFESFGPVFPIQQGMAPLQQLPFQFSVRRQEAQGEPFEVFHFLAKARDVNLHLLAESLLKALEEVASVVVYDAANERMILKQLKRLVPGIKESIDDAISKLVDIQEPFRNQWLYKDHMNGTSSLKKVIHAFSPENDYAQLEVSNGYEAATTFEEMLRTSDPIVKKRLGENLEQYCHQDTTAMVKLLRIMEAELSAQGSL